MIFAETFTYIRRSIYKKSHITMESMFATIKCNSAYSDD